MSSNSQTNMIKNRGAPRARPSSSGWRNWLVVAPFFLFTILFILLPSISLLTRAFLSNEGKFTFLNFLGLFDPSILNAYWISIRISLATALVGGLLGFLMAYAITVGNLPRPIRTALMTFSGVASNFAGVPLAFAFIATMGNAGLVTRWIESLSGVDIHQQGFTIYTITGLSIVYMYFQFPLMVLVMAPALDGLRRETAPSRLYSWRPCSHCTC